MPYSSLSDLRNDINAIIVTNNNNEIEGYELNRMLNGLVDFIQNNNLETVLTVGNTSTKSIFTTGTIQGNNLYNKANLNGTGLNKFLTTDVDGKLVLQSISSADIASVVNTILNTQKGAANGIAPLNSSAKIDTVYLPDSVLGNVHYKGTYNIVTNVITSDDSTLNGQPLPSASSGNVGYYFIVQGSGTVNSKNFNTGDWLISNGSAGWDKVDNTDAVATVFGRIGNVVAVAGDYTTALVTEDPGYVYFTSARARLSLSGGTGIAYDNTTGVIALDVSGVTANTYNNVTVDVYGRVTAGSNVSYELISNKATNLTSPDNTKYPTTLAVSTAIAAIPTSYTLNQVLTAGNTSSIAILLGGVTAAGSYDIETANKVRFNTNTYFGYGANNDNYITVGDSGKTIFRKTTSLTEVLWITNDGTVRLLNAGYVNLTATSKWITTDVNGDLIGKLVSWTDVQSKPSWIGASAPTLQDVTTSGNTTSLDIEFSTDKKIGNRLSSSDDYGWITFFTSADKYMEFKNTATTNGGFRFITPGTTNVIFDRNGNVGINVASPAVYAGYKTLSIGSTTGGVVDLVSGSTRIAQLYGISGGFSGFTTDSGSSGVIISTDSNLGFSLTRTQTLMNVGQITSPTNNSGFYTLAVGGGSGGVLDLYVNGTRHDQIFSSSTVFGFYSFQNKDWTFSPNATEQMRLKASGRLLIGTSSDHGELLQVAGTVYVNSSSNSTFLNSSTTIGDGFFIGNTTTKGVRLGYYNTNFYGFWPAGITPSTTNYSLLFKNDGTSVQVNSTLNVQYNISDVPQFSINGTGNHSIYKPGTTTVGEGLNIGKDATRSMVFGYYNANNQAIWGGGVTPSLTNYFILTHNDGSTLELNAVTSISLEIGGTIKGVYSAGGLYLGGNANATSKLHIAAGTASANTAPLKFNAGTILTISEAGVQEYNNTFYQTKNSGLRYALGGCIFDNYADVGNTSTTETDIYSYTTPANTLESNGGKIRATYALSLVNSTSTKEIKVYFAGTQIFTTGALTISASSSLIVYVDIIRVSSTIVRYAVSANTTGASTTNYASVGELTGLTLSATNILKITGTAAGVGAATNDIVGKMAIGNWEGLANN